MDELRLFTDRVRERDLDNFLVEELQASTSFRSWFLANLSEHIQPPENAEAQVRKSPPRPDGRQTDVQLGWFIPNGDLAACALIESKVTADFQPGQPEAYRQEVARLRQEYGPRSACSVLIAPAQKLQSLPGKECFDVTLSIEQMIEVLTQRRRDGVTDVEVDARLAVRAELLEALCGKRSQSSWTPLTVEEKREFAIAYAELAQLIVPQLRVRASTDGPKSLTRFFDGLSVAPDFPCAVALKHEFGNGVGQKYANIQLSGMAGCLDMLRQEPQLFADAAIYPAEGGKSLFVRIDTPSLSPDGSLFGEQRDNVVAGLQAIGKLAKWFGEHQSRLKALLAAKPETTIISPSVAEPNLEPAFLGAMQDIAARSFSVCRYKPNHMLGMLTERGGVGTAKSLINGQATEGFTRLLLEGHLELTVEALVLQRRWRSLFTEGELKIAEKRLKEAGYAGPYA